MPRARINIFEQRISEGIVRRKIITVKQLFTEVEMVSGGYLRSRV